MGPNQLSSGYQKNITRVSILILAVCFVGVSFLLTRGIELSDPALYIQNGLALSEGVYSIQPTVVSIRSGIVVCIAVLIKFFGLNFFGLSVLPLACSIGLLALLLYFFKKQVVPQLAAVVLFTFNTLLLTLGTYVGVDLPAVLFLFFTFIIVIQLQVNPGKNLLRNGLLAGTSLVCSFLFKEIVFFAIPALGFFFIRDLLKKQNLKFWIATAFVSLFLICIYFSWFKITTGNFFYRLSTIEGEHNTSQFSFFKRSPAEFLKRATYQPFTIILMSKDFIILSVLCAGYFFSNSNFKRIFRPVRGIDFIAIYFLITLCTYWFGSTSFSSYNPLPLENRMWFTLIPPMILLSANYIHSLLQLILQKKRTGKVLVYAPLILLFLLSLKFVYDTRQINKKIAGSYFAEKAFLNSSARNLNRNTLVITDSRLASLYFIYTKNTPRLTVRSWESLLQESQTQKVTCSEFDEVFILINRERSKMLYTMYEQHYLPDPEKVSARYPAVLTTENVLIYRFTGEEFSLKTFPGKLPRMYDLQ